MPKKEKFSGCRLQSLRDELFSAEKGGGISKWQTRLCILVALYDSIIIPDSTMTGEMMENTGSLYRLFKADIQGMRRMGALRLTCAGLPGRYDGYFGTCSHHGILQQDHLL